MSVLAGSPFCVLLIIMVVEFFALSWSFINSGCAIWVMAAVAAATWCYMTPRATRFASMPHYPESM